MSDVEWTDTTYSKLDPGIADMVRAFREAGIDTCQSCEGGRGHAWHRKTIEFWGDEADARRAIAVAANHGWPLRELAQVWDLRNPAAQFCWRITFNEPALLDWLEADRPLGHVVVNRHGQVCAYVAWPKPDGVEWPESWDKSHPEDAPHRVAALVPIEEEDS